MSNWAYLDVPITWLAPGGDFYVAPVSGARPLTVTAVLAQLDISWDYVVYCRIYWGDGTYTNFTASAGSVSKSYSSAGTYTLSLYISTTDGQVFELERENMVTVS